MALTVSDINKILNTYRATLGTKAFPNNFNLSTIESYYKFLSDIVAQSSGDQLAITNPMDYQKVIQAMSVLQQVNSLESIGDFRKKIAASKQRLRDRLVRSVDQGAIKTSILLDEKSQQGLDTKPVGFSGAFTPDDTSLNYANFYTIGDLEEIFAKWARTSQRVSLVTLTKKFSKTGEDPTDSLHNLLTDSIYINANPGIGPFVKYIADELEKTGYYQTLAKEAFANKGIDIELQYLINSIRNPQKLIDARTYDATTTLRNAISRLKSANSDKGQLVGNTYINLGELKKDEIEALGFIEYAVGPGNVYIDSATTGTANEIAEMRQLSEAMKTSQKLAAQKAAQKAKKKEELVDKLKEAHKQGKKFTDLDENELQYLNYLADKEGIDPEEYFKQNISKEVREFIPGTQEEKDRFKTNLRDHLTSPTGYSNLTPYQKDVISKAAKARNITEEEFLSLARSAKDDDEFNQLLAGHPDFATAGNMPASRLGEMRAKTADQEARAQGIAVKVSGSVDQEQNPHIAEAELQEPELMEQSVSTSARTPVSNALQQDLASPEIISDISSRSPVGPPSAYSATPNSLAEVNKLQNASGSNTQTLGTTVDATTTTTAKPISTNNNVATNLEVGQRELRSNSLFGLNRLLRRSTAPKTAAVASTVTTEVIKIGGGRKFINGALDIIKSDMTSSTFFEKYKTKLDITTRERKRIRGITEALKSNKSLFEKAIDLYSVNSVEPKLIEKIDVWLRVKTKDLAVYSYREGYTFFDNKIKNWEWLNRTKKKYGLFKTEVKATFDELKSSATAFYNSAKNSFANLLERNKDKYITKAYVGTSQFVKKSYFSTKETFKRLNRIRKKTQKGDGVIAFLIQKFFKSIGIAIVKQIKEVAILARNGFKTISEWQNGPRWLTNLSSAIYQKLDKFILTNTRSFVRIGFAKIELLASGTVNNLRTLGRIAKNLGGSIPIGTVVTLAMLGAGVPPQIAFATGIGVTVSNTINRTLQTNFSDLLKINNKMLLEYEAIEKAGRMGIFSRFNRFLIKGNNWLINNISMRGISHIKKMFSGFEVGAEMTEATQKFSQIGFPKFAKYFRLFNSAFSSISIIAPLAFAFLNPVAAITVTVVGTSAIVGGQYLADKLMVKYALSQKSFFKMLSRVPVWSLINHAQNLFYLRNELIILSDKYRWRIDKYLKNEFFNIDRWNSLGDSFNSASRIAFGWVGGLSAIYKFGQFVLNANRLYYFSIGLKSLQKNIYGLIGTAAGFGIAYLMGYDLSNPTIQMGGWIGGGLGFIASGIGAAIFLGSNPVGWVIGGVLILGTAIGSLLGIHVGFKIDQWMNKIGNTIVGLFNSMVNGLQSLLSLIMIWRQGLDIGNAFNFFMALTGFFTALEVFQTAAGTNKCTYEPTECPNEESTAFSSSYLAYYNVKVITNKNSDHSYYVNKILSIMQNTDKATLDMIARKPIYLVVSDTYSQSYESDKAIIMNINPRELEKANNFNTVAYISKLALNY